jgi:hypothetical protein
LQQAEAYARENVTATPPGRINRRSRSGIVLWYCQNRPQIITEGMPFGGGEEGLIVGWQGAKIRAELEQATAESLPTREPNHDYDGWTNDNFISDVDYWEGGPEYEY